ncbi:MAG: NAD-dependent epimerase/dehydratase family protein [Gammaproteobacteria bacterium]|nr:NAD-dependent epimerase/dehydratase family protein [Gammaproteobacteria bacterium]
MSSNGILILGGSGFIGRSLIDRLISKGRHVYVISSKAHSLPTNKNLYALSGSMDDKKLLKKSLPHCKTVFHLASKTTPGTFINQPSYEVINNILPTTRFLEFLQNYKDVDLIYLSSGGVLYGNPEKTPVEESAPLNPVSYYSSGKIAIEAFVKSYCQKSNNNAVILRPSNIYGPGQLFQPGFGVIPSIFHHILNTKEFSIWGDGSNTRDYLFISDFVNLCEELINSPSNTGVNVYNVASNQSASINHLCDTIENITHEKLFRRFYDSRQVDVKDISLNCSHLFRQYQWRPNTKLNYGLIETWKWFKKQYSDNNK